MHPGDGHRPGRGDRGDRPGRSRTGDDKDRPGEASSYARLPGAVTKAPDWIGADAPFDVGRFFDAVPPDRNAAPCYLDAFLEFGSDVAACFPEGPERSQTKPEADSRTKRYMILYERLRKDEADVPRRKSTR